MKYKICNYSNTIRLMPQNYWVASIVGNKLVFDSWDGATKRLFKERKISKIGIRWFYFRYKLSKIFELVADFLYRNNIGRVEFIVYCAMSLLAALWLLAWVCHVCQ